MTKPKDALTQRQEAFCLAFIETGNASEAYRRAYQPKRMTAKSVHEKASHIMALPKVADRVQALREKAADKAGLTLETHLTTLATLRDLAKDKRDFDAAIRAEKHRGEAAGLYPDRSKVSVNLNVPGKSEPVSATERWLNEEFPERDGISTH